MLNKAILLATTYHAGQYDRGGNPYILHPLKVMHYLKTEDEELMCIAVMHDLLEDTSATVDTLIALEFSNRVIQAVQALTKIEGQTYDEYKQGIFNNQDAMKVKMCDLRHNSDIRRLKSKKITEKDIARMIKYHQFYLEIQSHLTK